MIKIRHGARRTQERESEKSEGCGKVASFLRKNPRKQDFAMQPEENAAKNKSDSDCAGMKLSFAYEN